MTSSPEAAATGAPTVNPRLITILGAVAVNDLAEVEAEAARARGLGLHGTAAGNLANALYWRATRRLIDFCDVTLMCPVGDDTLHRIAAALLPRWPGGQRHRLVERVRAQRDLLLFEANNALVTTNSHRECRTVPDMDNDTDTQLRIRWGIATYFGYLLDAFLQQATIDQSALPDPATATVSFLDHYRRSSRHRH